MAGTAGPIAVLTDRGARTSYPLSAARGGGGAEESGPVAGNILKSWARPRSSRRVRVLFFRGGLQELGGFPARVREFHMGAENDKVFP